jgi:hypothetical protein
MPSGLPLDLDAAETDFRAFLAGQRYPAVVEWISIVDVVIDASGRYFVHRNGLSSRPDAVRRYQVGREEKLGVELRAICANETKTFACVVVPKDSTDAKYRMIGQNLKMSCPDHRVLGREISNAVKWNALKLANRGRNRILQET